MRNVAGYNRKKITQCYNKVTSIRRTEQLFHFEICTETIKYVWNHTAITKERKKKKRKNTAGFKMPWSYHRSFAHRWQHKQPCQRETEHSTFCWKQNLPRFCWPLPVNSFRLRGQGRRGVGRVWGGRGQGGGGGRVFTALFTIMAVILERFSVWNMLHCAEQVQIPKYKNTCI